MYKKSSGIIVLFMIATMILVACRTSTTNTKEIDCTKTEILCVGLVTGLGGVKDKSVNQMAWEGVLVAQTEKVADRVQYIETVDAKDYGNHITTLAQAGYDVVITVGSLQSDATSTSAISYPNTLFIGVDQEQSEVLLNLAGLVFHEDQAGFQAGSLAALLTRTNTIAVVLGPNTLPAVVTLKEGYEAGAKYINPNIKILSTYYPNDSEVASTDPRWAAGVALQAIQNGADIILDAGGMTGNGALIEVAGHPGVYCIGVDSDQWELLTEARSCLLTSAMKFITQGVFDIIKLAREGAFPSGNFYGATGLAPYHDFDTVVPQAVKAEMDQIAVGLISGSISSGAKIP